MEAPKILETLMCSTSKLYLFLGKALIQASETNLVKNLSWNNNFDEIADKRAFSTYS